jgi:hypothetical protein
MLFQDSIQLVMKTVDTFTTQAVSLRWDALLELNFTEYWMRNEKIEQNHMK